MPTVTLKCVSQVGKLSLIASAGELVMEPFCWYYYYSFFFFFWSKRICFSRIFPGVIAVVPSDYSTNTAFISCKAMHWIFKNDFHVYPKSVLFCYSMDNFQLMLFHNVCVLFIYMLRVWIVETIKSRCTWQLSAPLYLVVNMIRLNITWSTGLS